MRCLAFAAALLLPSVGFADWFHFGTPGLDPVTTYTNGMPLASSSSLRSHHYAWRCDPEHVGCCDGRYNCPCLNSALTPNTCACGGRLAYGGREPAAESGWAAVEAGSFESLGSLMVQQGVGPGGQPGAGVLPRR